MIIESKKESDRKQLLRAVELLLTIVQDIGKLIVAQNRQAIASGSVVRGIMLGCLAV